VRTAPKHRRLTQTDHGDADSGSSFAQPGLLEVSDHERVAALLLGDERVADDGRSAAELGDRMQEAVARLNAVHLDLYVG